MKTLRLLLPLILVALAATLRAQIVDLPYGAPIPLADAKRVLAAAQAEATKNKWNVAVAVVNTHGSLVYYERMSNTQSASARIADRLIEVMVFPHPPFWLTTAMVRMRAPSSVCSVRVGSRAQCAPGYESHLR